MTNLTQQQEMQQQDLDQLAKNIALTLAERLRGVSEFHNSYIMRCNVQKGSKSISDIIGEGWPHLGRGLKGLGDLFDRVSDFGKTKVSGVWSTYEVDQKLTESKNKAGNDQYSFCVSRRENEEGVHEIKFLIARSESHDVFDIRFKTIDGANIPLRGHLIGLQDLEDIAALEHYQLAEDIFKKMVNQLGVYNLGFIAAMKASENPKNTLYIVQHPA